MRGVWGCVGVGLPASWEVVIVQLRKFLTYCDNFLVGEGVEGFGRRVLTPRARTYFVYPSLRPT